MAGAVAADLSIVVVIVFVVRTAMDDDIEFRGMDNQSILFITVVWVCHDDHALGSMM